MTSTLLQTREKCQEVPRLRKTTLQPADTATAEETQHDSSKVLRLPRKITMGTSKVRRLPRKMQRIFCKRRKSIALATQNDFPHVTVRNTSECHEVPRLPCETKQCDLFKPPKVTPFADLTIGTAIRPSRGWLRICGRLRTVADGCERLRT